MFVLHRIVRPLSPLLYFTYHTESTKCFRGASLYRSITNLWSILQLWAYINVENPYIWPHGKSYWCKLQHSNYQSRMEMRSSGITFEHNVNQLQIIYEVGIFIIMYIFMLTEGIIRAHFNVDSNMLVCVISRYNYNVVYYLLIFSHSFD